MGYIDHKEYALIKQHSIMLLYYLVKFIFFIIITASLSIFLYFFKDKIWAEITDFFFFPLILCLLTYAFIKLVLGLIIYYNNLVIFLHDKIIILKSSLFLLDDVEIIDVSKIMKIDVQIHWFFANLLWYGNLVVEQQRDELLILRFIPSPYKALQLLREKTSYLHTSDDLSFFKLKW